MEFDGEAFGQGVVTAIKAHVAAMFERTQAQFDQLKVQIKTLENADEWYELAPDDIADEISKAVALLAESPTLHPASQVNPVVVNFSPSNASKKSKTITTRRDEAGNLVAKVVED